MIFASFAAVALIFLGAMASAFQLMPGDIVLQAYVMEQLDEVKDNS